MSEWQQYKGSEKMPFAGDITVITKTGKIATGNNKMSLRPDNILAWKEGPAIGSEHGAEELLIKGLLYDLPQDDRNDINGIAEAIRKLIFTDFEKGVIALGLIGLEIQ